jgi:hypothetical protein
MKKNFEWFSLCVMVVLILCSTANAQTVRVAADGSGDFTTIQDAVDAVEMDDSTLPNVVMVATGTYPDTSVVISQEMTIMGEDADNRPVLVLEPAADDTDSIVNSAGVDVTLENLICIPSTANPAGRAIRLDPVAEGDAFVITISNVLVSANDGSDQPLSVDGLEALFPGPDTSMSFGDDGIRILAGQYASVTNADVTIDIDNTIVTHIDSDRDPSQPTGGRDGFVLGGANTTINFGPGVLASYCGRYGAQIITSDASSAPDFTPVLNCNGTLENPILFKGCGSVGLQLWTGVHDLNYVHIDENPVGIRADMFSNTIDADHLLATENEEAIAWLNYAPSVGTTFNFLNSTFFYGESADILFSTGLTADNATSAGPASVVFENSIFAASIMLFNTDMEMDIVDLVQDKFVLDYVNVAFPAEGEFSVFPEFEFYPVTANLQNIEEADPMFISTDPTSSDYLVVSNEAYRTAGTNNSPLGGYFPFNNEDTSVTHWMMF